MSPSTMTTPTVTIVVNSSEPVTATPAMRNSTASGLNAIAGGASRCEIPKIICVMLGMAMSRPSDGTSFTSGGALWVERNKARSSAMPIAGLRSTTATTNAAHLGQPLPTATSKTNAATYACAPNAMLKTPEALYVRTRPSAISAYAHPYGIPGSA